MPVINIQIPNAVLVATPLVIALACLAGFVRLYRPRLQRVQWSLIAAGFALATVAFGMPLAVALFDSLVEIAHAGLRSDFWIENLWQGVKRLSPTQAVLLIGTSAMQGMAVGGAIGWRLGRLGYVLYPHRERKTRVIARAAVAGNDSPGMDFDAVNASLGAAQLSLNEEDLQERAPQSLPSFESSVSSSAPPTPTPSTRARIPPALETAPEHLSMIRFEDPPALSLSVGRPQPQPGATSELWSRARAAQSRSFSRSFETGVWLTSTPAPVGRASETLAASSAGAGSKHVAGYDERSQAGYSLRHQSGFDWSKLRAGDMSSDSAGAGMRPSSTMRGEGSIAVEERAAREGDSR
ncbi:hypothetical protein HMN09_01351800 [Mycena chlorophos]|uniref:Uncharacterized protein n=1 Tax=Mycena chlorophos TaxID=658473 RepID=A0A8H6VT30_MYCCL|nr:hypothetical protein HMN09_01351800 [Mycena chlorophos]